MTASQTGVKGAVERLTKPLHAPGAVMTNGAFAGGLIFASDLRAILTDHAGLTARIAALEGERVRDGHLMQLEAETLERIAFLAQSRLAARQSREETGDRT